ncbi:diguanylate cyclase domain-containing protein [Pleionea sp. CnH1-48]|uniref:diguanylate cyclase domain-containing protein n=1 Tax=Pleionea sp. CnH1-48 TaxID=2954494 RepID=UPI0020980137|nr:diguanylate cyclase [Pleionea sp. CnH1-48]MCO7223409.1 diguanylate cyclase [Pleionea sp. CnH1-48]
MDLTKAVTHHALVVLLHTLLGVVGFYLTLAFLLLVPVTSNAASLKLSAQHQEFVRQNPVVTYCVDPNWMPFEGIIDGKHEGISADYIKLLEQKSGLQFQLVPTSSWSQSLEYFKSEQCRLLAMVNQTTKRKKQFLFSKVYLKDPVVIVTQDDVPFISGLSSLSGQRVGIPKNYAQEEYVRENYPRIHVVSMGSELEGLHWVSEGKLDASIGSLLSVNKLIRESGLGNLKISGRSSAYDELAFSAKKDQGQLIEVLDFLINKISEQEHIIIFKKWSSVQYVSEIDYSYLWQAGLIILLITIITLERYLTIRTYNLKLEKKAIKLEKLKQDLEDRNRRLEYISIHDDLTKLKNRQAINQSLYFLTNQANRYHYPLSMLLIDIDNFKHVNDRYGHQVGDQVLVAVAELIMTAVRNTDITGRWGGEEFIVICPHTQQNQIEELCNRIATQLKQYTMPQSLTITCSFGISEYTSNETVEKWFERTDTALYQAKANGRDTLCYAEAV